jgi:hypothetical protein
VVTRYLEGLLFGVRPLDPTMFIGIWIVFGCLAAAAAVVPGRNALRIDPIQSIRCREPSARGKAALEGRP